MASLGKEQFPDAGKQIFGEGFELVLKPNQRQPGQLLQHTLLKNRFFQRMSFGDGGATRQVVLPKTNPDNIRHGSRQGLHSTETHLVVKAQDSSSRISREGESQLTKIQHPQPALATRTHLPTGMPLPLVPLKVNWPFTGPLKHFLPNSKLVTQDP